MSRRRTRLSIVFTCLLAMAGAGLAGERDRAATRDELLERQRADLRRTERAELFLSQQQPTQRLEQRALTTCDAGLADIYPCNNVDLLAFLPLSTIGGGSGNDIWGWTDPMTGREYALMGRSSGVSFVDITDPVNPVYVGNLPTHSSNSSWRDVKVYADHAYVVSEAFSHGMQIFDLTQLRDVVAPPVTFSNTAHYDDFTSAHNLVINEDSGYAYAVGTTTCSGGLHMIDLSVPTAPVFAGCHNETVYTHDAQCVIYSGPDLDHQGREICINSNENRITVVDVTDKAATAVLSTTTYSGTGYVHQGWLTEDQRYYIQGDELDEQNFGHNTRSRILDMSDLDDPQLIGTYDGSTPAIDHNMYTLDGYLYQANYRAGLQIFDLSDIGLGTLTEVARFDIYPSNDNDSFNGAWSVYPYFPSGNVVVSGIEQGLFVLSPALSPDFVVQAAPLQLSVCSPDTSDVGVDLAGRNGYAGDVTLSTVSLPAGAGASFSTNPVTVPGSSTMTVDPGTLAAGDYAFQLEATDGSITRLAAVSLTVADVVPDAPVATGPTDGAVDVPRTTLLTWDPVAQAASYDLEVATDAGFLDVVYSATVSSTSHVLAISLEPESGYSWRVRAGNACGTGGYSAAASFTTVAVPPLLVVDDDDNSPDVRDAYTLALEQLGVAYDLWDTDNSDDEPSAAALAPYRQVIWFTGDEFGGFAGPGGGGESALAAWLDGSACLLLASQDYYYDRGLTGFMQSHLGVASATSDTGQSSAEGTGSLFGGFGTYTLDYPYTNYSDDIVPDGTAEGAFIGSNANMSAVDKDTGVYRTLFMGFGVETLPNDNDERALLTDFLAWCDVLPTLDPDTDGATNADDCAPGDATAWSLPGGAQGLFVSTAAADNVTWLAPAVLGADAVSYDLLRADAADGFAAATCLVTDSPTPLATDAVDPAPGAAYYYLVRTRNACGGTLGDGRAQPGATCP